MRRIILAIPAILGLLFTTGSCVTQGQGQSAGQPLTQRGMATQEMPESLSASHASFPIGSTVRVTNINNGKKIFVTITGQIPPSATRVIDLSPSTALALDIGKGGPVTIDPLGQRIILQRGMATQEMTDDGLTAAHPAFLVGSMAKVTNINNGKEIEVTITRRIPPSTTCVIDLSPGAALALGIGKGGPVEVYSSPQLTQRGIATQEMTYEYLTAAHPSFPIGSKARVLNIANSKEIEVTITRRIPQSNTRVIDLSPAAVLALDIGKGGPVIIEVLSTP